MFRFLGIALAMILTSFAIFPIELVWFPGLTLKTAMAPLGLVMLLINFARQRRSVWIQDSCGLVFGQRQYLLSVLYL